MGPDPAVAAVRLAVRRVARTLPDGPLLVACSGGADSLALLAAAVFESRGGRRVIGVTVDHGLQQDSAAHASHVVAQMAGLGVDETVSVRVSVEAAGQGPEAAAREARYAVLEEVAERFEGQVLLGHTRDDQAETVLLGLARGSGGRSLAGMRPAFDRFHRPLLDVTRAQTEAACRAQGIEWWTDPHNSDPAYTRVRVRDVVLPLLERELGPGVAEALARTAELTRRDVEALDAEAERVFVTPLPVALLESVSPAIRGRLLRLGALAGGALGSELNRQHVAALEALVTDWHGQRWVELPGQVRAGRRRDDGGDVLVFSPTT